MSHRGYKRTQRVIELRRKEAEDRQAIYDKLTLKEKLERLPPPPQAEKVRQKLLAQGNKALNPNGPPKVSLGANLPAEWVGKTSEEIDALPAEEPKKLKAKERRAQEKQ